MRTCGPPNRNAKRRNCILSQALSIVYTRHLYRIRLYKCSRLWRAHYLSKNRFTFSVFGYSAWSFFFTVCNVSNTHVLVYRTCRGILALVSILWWISRSLVRTFEVLVSRKLAANLNFQLGDRTNYSFSKLLILFERLVIETMNSYLSTRLLCCVWKKE